jgi:hypothetical protein
MEFRGQNISENLPMDVEVVGLIHLSCTTSIAGIEISLYVTTHNAMKMYGGLEV